jgi:hypothetical protein
MSQSRGGRKENKILQSLFHQLTPSVLPIHGEQGGGRGKAVWGSSEGAFFPSWLSESKRDGDKGAVVLKEQKQKNPWQTTNLFFFAQRCRRWCAWESLKHGESVAISGR